MKGLKTKGGVVIAFTACVMVNAIAFEKIAFVDSMDFGSCFETESREGTGRIIDHVLQTGADSILWRSHNGAVPAYASACDDMDRLEMPFDRRRMPCDSLMNWSRIWGIEGDTLKVVYEECAKRLQLRDWGVHMVLEDAHWQFSFLGNWNLEHPQYFCRDRDGTVKMFHQSFAYPEVVQHRLDIVHDILDHGTKTVFLDAFRNGGWWPMVEFVKPNIDEWKMRHPDKPLPKWTGGRDDEWREWLEISCRGLREYLQGIHDLTKQHGARFLLNIDYLGDEDEGLMYRECGFDWRQLVGDGIIDGLVVTGISADEKDPFGSVERRFGRVAKQVKAAGKSIYFPILQYHFRDKRPSYDRIAKWAGVTSPEAVRRLLEIAVRCEATGIVMECVDYGNYKSDVCEVIRNFTANKEN